MPNYCDFSIKIVGSKESCRKFLSRMTNYEIKNHFYRIFEASVYDEGTYDSGEKYMCIGGFCAWSLESCCRASGYSNGVDLFEVNTRDLKLKMEAYSREPGVGFEEHYIYQNGECLKDVCLDIDTFWWDTTEYPSYNDFKSAYPDAPPESCFAETDEVYVGGFGDIYECWHI